MGTRAQIQRVPARLSEVALAYWLAWGAPRLGYVQVTTRRGTLTSRLKFSIVQ